MSNKAKTTVSSSKNSGGYKISNPNTSRISNTPPPKK